MSNENIWYYSLDDQQRHGPVSWEEILAAVNSGALRPEAMVWAPHLSQWQPLSGLLPSEHPFPQFPPSIPFILPAQALVSDQLASSDPQSQSQVPDDVPENPTRISSYFWLFVNLAAFVYNCYAITNNLMIKSGYIYIAIGLVINVYILVSFPGTFIAIFPKLNKILSYAVLGVGLIIGISSGFESRKKILENESISVVTQILKEQLGSEAATCKSVTIEKEISSGFYRATAHLDNGNDINIGIEDKEKEFVVTIAK